MQEETTVRRSRSHTSYYTTGRYVRRIVWLAMEDHAATSRTLAQQIQSVTHFSVSTRTIRRRLQQSGMPESRPLLRSTLIGSVNFAKNSGHGQRNGKHSA
ncbi:hypothetical protein TNCV_3069821 [Trichonephila clavipes]|nr:hypothetical protein TNCV_3069821 [Trichonephila clavipes]